MKSHTNEKPFIVLGVTGSIAAYKAADITSKLVQRGIDVQVIMTAAAQKLVCPQTFLTLSQNPVVTDLWEMPDWKPGHISMAMRAKILLVAPATANILAKMANGIADDALSTYFISHTASVLVAPAMNPRMWSNAATVHNCETLRSRGVEFIGPEEGHVACGEDGKGRMAAVETIVDTVLAKVATFMPQRYVSGYLVSK